MPGRPRGVGGHAGQALGGIGARGMEGKWVGAQCLQQSSVPERFWEGSGSESLSAPSASFYGPLRGTLVGCRVE